MDARLVQALKYVQVSNQGLLLLLIKLLNADLVVRPVILIGLINAHNAVLDISKMAQIVDNAPQVVYNVLTLILVQNVLTI